jgi:hypothetical protein
LEKNRFVLLFWDEMFATFIVAGNRCKNLTLQYPEKSVRGKNG